MFLGLHVAGFVFGVSGRCEGTAMTSIQRIRPEGLVSSLAFSHVAIVPPGATHIYVGGQNAVDADGSFVRPSPGRRDR